MRGRPPASRRYRGCLGPGGRTCPACAQHQPRGYAALPGDARSRQPVLLPGYDRVDRDRVVSGVSRKLILDRHEWPGEDPRRCPVQHPSGQVAVALSPVSGRQRRTLDGCDVAPHVLGEKAGGRMSQPVRPGRVQDGAAVAHRRGCVVGPIRVFAPEVQPVWGHVERAVQGDLADDYPVRVVIAAERGHTAQDVRADDAVFVARPEDAAVVDPDEAVGVGVAALEQAAASEQDASEALRRPRRVRCQRVLERLRNVARLVDRRFPGVSKNYLRVRVERVDAAPQQVAAVQVVGSRPLEQFAARLLEHEVVVRGEADVARLADVADPGVLLAVATADIGGAVGRGVVRDDQLEILVALAEQGIEGLADVVLAVVHREPDAHRGRRGHCAPTSRLAGRGMGTTTARMRPRSPAAGTLIDGSSRFQTTLAWAARQLPTTHDPRRAGADTSWASYFAPGAYRASQAKTIAQPRGRRSQVVTVVRGPGHGGLEARTGAVPGSGACDPSRKDRSRGATTSASKSRQHRSLANPSAVIRAGAQSSRSISVAAAWAGSSSGQNRPSTPSSQSSEIGPMLPATMGRPAAIASMIASDDDSEYEAWT